jgi:hypothetical protein
MLVLTYDFGVQLTFFDSMSQTHPHAHKSGFAALFLMVYSILFYPYTLMSTRNDRHLQLPTLF